MEKLLNGNVTYQKVKQEIAAGMRLWKDEKFAAGNRIWMLVAAGGILSENSGMPLVMRGA